VSCVYIVAPHLRWAKRWADEQFRAGTLNIKEVSYSVRPGALDGLSPEDTVFLVNPVMCTGEKWELVKDALRLRRSGLCRVVGASTETVARFTQKMQGNPRHIPFEPKAGM
jgi:hypothetical protein